MSEDMNVSLNYNIEPVGLNVFAIKEKPCVDAPEIYEILSQFDPQKDAHVDYFTNRLCIGGEVYIFYTNDKKLYGDYTTANYN
jgi:hypothetical protein